MCVCAFRIFQEEDVNRFKCCLCLFTCFLETNKRLETALQLPIRTIQMDIKEEGHECNYATGWKSSYYTVQYTISSSYHVFHAVNDRKNNLHHFNKFLSAGAENLVSSCSRSYTQFSLLESIWSIQEKSKNAIRNASLLHFNKLLSEVAENLVSSCSGSYTQFSLLESIWSIQEKSNNTIRNASLLHGSDW